MLFDDHEADAARDNASTGRAADGSPMHSFQTLLADLATIARNRVLVKLPGAEPFDVFTRPSGLQRRAFQPLGVRLERTQ